VGGVKSKADPVVTSHPVAQRRPADQLGAAPPKEAAKFQCKAVVTLMAALGFTLSLTICQLVLKQTAKFLGMLVHADWKAFEVPPGKVTALEQLVTCHMVARVMVELEDWDAALPDPAVALEQAALFLELLRTKIGISSWRKGPWVVLRLVGDASDRAYAAFLPDGQLTEFMCAPFSPGEVDCMTRGIFSSTERELGTLRHALEWLQQRAPDLLRGKLLQYQRPTDALSKYEDVSQWLLNPRVYQELLRRPELGAEAQHSIADSFSTKVPRAFC